MWSRIRVRHMDRTDHRALREVFAGLSDFSRYRRFHGPMAALTPAAEARLLDLDGHRHVAVLAEGRERRRWRPVGIARYVREPDDRAELAIEVVDAWQGRGVGTRLVRELTEHARRGGVRELYGDVLVDNQPVQRLLSKGLPGARTIGRGPTRRIAGTLETTLTVEDILVDLGRQGAFPFR